jgi:hypothetical protein
VVQDEAGHNLSLDRPVVMDKSRSATVAYGSLHTIGDCLIRIIYKPRTDVMIGILQRRPGTIIKHPSGMAGKHGRGERMLLGGTTRRDGHR